MTGTTQLDEIRQKILGGERLSREDGCALASTRDLIALGLLGEEARRRRHDDRITFVRVAQVSVDAGDPAAVPEPPSGCGEVCLVGVPERLEEAIAWVAATKTSARGLPLSGFRLSDLLHLAQRERVDLAAVLGGLREAGLEMVAEAPLDLLAQPESALGTLPDAGLGLARMTVDTAGDDDAWLGLLASLVHLQDRLGWLHGFAPLARVTGATPTTGYDDVKRVALARLLADNIESIQVDWGLHGPKLAQVALTFGADDLDAVSAEDGLEGGARRAPLEEVRRNIRAACLEPVERNGRFETDFR